MNLQQKYNRDQELIEYLCTKLREKKNGKPVYPTIEEGARKFGLSTSQTFRIKKESIGLDVNGERQQINGTS